MTPVERVRALHEVALSPKPGMRLCVEAFDPSTDAEPHVVVIGWVVDHDGAPVFVDTRYVGTRLPVTPLAVFLAGWRRSLPVPDLDDEGTAALCLRALRAGLAERGKWNDIAGFVNLDAAWGKSDAEMVMALLPFWT